MSMTRNLPDVTDDEILDAALRAHGVDGFDNDDEQSHADIAEALDLYSGIEREDETMLVALRTRLSALEEAGRMEGQGCYGIRLTFEEVAKRLAGNTAEEIAIMLRGSV